MRYIVIETGSNKKPYAVKDVETGMVVSKHSWKRFAIEAADKLNQE